MEVEALDPTYLRALLQAEVDAVWDTDAYEDALEREAGEVGQLQELARGLG